jgi:hypothetical protein
VKWVLTTELAERVLGAFCMGADWQEAARLAGTSRMTLRRAVEADSALAERVEDARAQADEVVIHSLYTKATVGKDTTAMIFWLKNRRPDEWRDRRELNLTADVKTAAQRMAADIGVSAEEIVALATRIATSATPEGFVQ